jgi:hypothetical protein
MFSSDGVVTARKEATARSATRKAESSRLSRMGSELIVRSRCQHVVNQLWRPLPSSTVPMAFLVQARGDLGQRGPPPLGAWERRIERDDRHYRDARGLAAALVLSSCDDEQPQSQ